MPRSAIRLACLPERQSAIASIAIAEPFRLLQRLDAPKGRA